MTGALELRSDPQVCPAKELFSRNGSKVMLVRMYLRMVALPNLRFYCARLKLMSPVVVRTFNVGPPPFRLPSADKVFDPQSPSLWT